MSWPFVMEDLLGNAISVAFNHALINPNYCFTSCVVIYYWASEASPTLGCSIEISRDIYMYIYTSKEKSI